MSLLGLSLLLATAVYAVLRPPAWLFRLRACLRSSATADRDAHTACGQPARPTAPSLLRTPVKDDDGDDPSVPAPVSPIVRVSNDVAGPDSPSTPRAPTSYSGPPGPIPSLSLVDQASLLATPTTSTASSYSTSPSMMPSPQRPSHSLRPPSLAQFPAANSIQRAGPTTLLSSPAAGRDSLAPPPVPPSRRANRKVLLAPGRSLLDWARLIGGPSAHALRGLPAHAPYLRVPPSTLRQHSGSNGSDAWMALNGRVYNISPYAEFHPGGIPELMRGAGRDASAIFARVHPWVNYEAMLAPCLVGLAVDEPQPGSLAPESDMDQMD